ncbi:Tn7 transposase TnsA N-terminal domain-containing protein [Vibrio coralliirubri]|uniref:Tn7 transposase TnsA N-terminal domain-containing protein n=1 Tax=Vibrio coralliirubri TaxID=1516159 RepID=UPI001EE3A47F|nr:Tn7 transposase TnsA N-terminal domain-containing protein [Vibrio coralliirubri]
MESDLEFDVCVHFEFSPQIVNFEAQPIGFEYFIEGKRRRYTPDFLVTYKDSYQSFYEIKPKHIAEKDEFKEKFRAQKEQTLDCGQDLYVLREDGFQIYPLLENHQTDWRWLYQWRHNHW